MEDYKLDAPARRSWLPLGQIGVAVWLTGGFLVWMTAGLSYKVGFVTMLCGLALGLAGLWRLLLSRPRDSAGCVLAVTAPVTLVAFTFASLAWGYESLATFGDTQTWVGQATLPVFHQLVREGRVSDAREILERSPWVLERPGRDGRTALHAAAAGRSKEMVAFLLSYQPDVNVLDAQQVTPLIDAVKTGRVENVELLLRAGADPKQGRCRHGSLLGVAIFKQLPLDLLTQLYRAGAEMGKQDPRYRSPLKICILRGNAGYVEWCLQHGARVDEVDSQGDNALHSMAGCHPSRDVFENILDLLLRGSGGARALKQVNREGLTPKELLARHGYDLDARR